MDMLEQLDDLEDRLTTVRDCLEAHDYDAAREAAEGVADVMDCPLCKNLEHGILGGIMFAASFTPSNKPERTQVVIDEIDRFIEEDLPEARENVREVTGAPGGDVR